MHSLNRRHASHFTQSASLGRFGVKAILQLAQVGRAGKRSICASRSGADTTAP